jgi:hypothetical protein
MTAAAAELVARCRAAGLSLTAEGEALHVDFERDPPGDLIEEFRRFKPEVMAALAGAMVLAPVQLFECEPPYNEPCPALRGVVRRPRGRFEHFCAVCGAWGAFGFGVAGDAPGRWYCLKHRPSD